ncbi:DUF6233 domain-containing protein [Streptomyces sp. NPDC093795]|uniref:DUF6233 domain-containing protein n=1 Tax=Streptomyces sp. NPDC093795 TaxID=3366051 RepID=UPI0037F41EB7
MSGPGQPRPSGARKRCGPYAPGRQSPAGSSLTSAKAAAPYPAAAHIGDCHLAGRHTRPLTRDEARHAPAEGGLPACEICRPDSDLGILV